MPTALAFWLFIQSVLSQGIPFPGSGMAHAISGGGNNIAHIATAKASNASTGTSVAVSTAATPSVGETITVTLNGAQSGSFTAFTTCADNQTPSNTYVSAVSKYTNDGITVFATGVAIYYAIVVTSTGTFTITCNSTGSTYLTIFASRFSGIAAVSLTDGAASAASNSDDPQTCGSNTTGNANDVNITGFVSNSGNANVAFTVPAGYTIPTNGSVTDGASFAAGGAAYKLLTATGAQAPTWGTTAHPDWQACVQVAFKST